MNIDNLISSYKKKDKVSAKPNSKEKRNYTHSEDEVKAQAVELRLSGMTFSNIGKAVGASRSAVRAWCLAVISSDKAEEITKNTRVACTKALNAEKDKRIIKIKEMLSEDGSLSNRAIARALGVVSTTINRDMKEVKADIERDKNCQLESLVFA